MSNQFFETSKVVANDFLQSIVFVDDEAYANKDEEHDLDVPSVTKVFAKSQKICSIYNPLNESDILDLIPISKKADIVILDWKIDLQKKTLTKSEEETDEEKDDPRGLYTMQIIKGVLSNNNVGVNGLKMFVIYTGETNLWQITENIYNQLVHDVEGLQKNEFEVSAKNVKIVVIGKGSIRAKHINEIEARIKSYEELPEFILTEFTKMTSGLLSNTAIKALTQIRKNSFKLIETFHPSIDPAFLSHRALLPNPVDSEEHLLDIIGSEIKSILKSCDLYSYISKDDIRFYIEQNLEEKNYPFHIPYRKDFKTLVFPNEIDRNLLIKFTEVGIENLFFKRDTPSLERNLFSNNCYQSLTSYYSSNEDLAKESDKKFALLTSVKSNYNSRFSPLLTQGSIIKKADNTYWLCIQPKCDTNKIIKNREFLFVALKIREEISNFDFLLKIQDEYLYFKVNNNVYQSQFFNFKANANQEVRGTFENTKILFKGNTNPPMEWVAELKSDFAQSISNQFASNLSRVGMDHSEWLRRSS